MKYFGIAITTVGLLIMTGAENETWFPMFTALVALGFVTSVAGLGIIYSTINEDS